MIDKVIVCGIHRASNLVPEVEIRQMIGRVGRSYNYGDKGEAYILVSEKDKKQAEKYLFGDPPAIESQLNNVDNLMFHILPHVYSRDVYDDITVESWFSRSLSYYQNNKINFDELFNFLKLLQMIDGDNRQFYITELGKVSCKFYLRPKRVFRLKERFEELIVNKLIDNDYAISWAFASEKLSYNVDYGLYDLYVSNVKSLGLRFNGDEKDGMAYYGIYGDFKARQLNYVMNDYEDDMPRLLNAVKYISKIEKWNIEKNLDIIMKMFEKRVKYNEAKIMIENNINSKSHLRRFLGDCFCE